MSMLDCLAGRHAFDATALRVPHDTTYLCACSTRRMVLHPDGTIDLYTHGRHDGTYPTTLPVPRKNSRG